MTLIILRNTPDKSNSRDVLLMEAWECQQQPGSSIAALSEAGREELGGY